MNKSIVGALRSCIRAHGPIDSRNIGSAAKRIVGALELDGLWEDPKQENTAAETRPLRSQ